MEKEFSDDPLFCELQKMKVLKKEIEIWINKLSLNTVSFEDPELGTIDPDILANIMVEVLINFREFYYRQNKRNKQKGIN